MGCVHVDEKCVCVTCGECVVCGMYEICGLGVYVWVCVVCGEVDVRVVWPVPSVSMGYMWCLGVVCEGHVCVCVHMYTGA